MTFNNLNSELQTIKKSIDDEHALILLKKFQGQLELRSLLMLYNYEVSKHIDLAQLAWDNDFERVTLRSETILLEESQGHRQAFLLRFGEKSLGILQYHTIHPLDLLEIELLHEFHRLIAGPLSNALVYQEAKTLAFRHHLSNLYNQLCFDNDLESAINETILKSNGLIHKHSKQNNLILLLFAIDSLKEVSFLQGQKVLLQLARILQQFDDNPIASYHLDNNQFALLLYPITPEEAAQVALDVEQKISEETQLDQFNLKHLLGFSEYQQGDTSLSMLERANKELYQQTLKHKEL